MLIKNILWIQLVEPWSKSVFTEYFNMHPFYAKWHLVNTTRKANWYLLCIPSIFSSWSVKIAIFETHHAKNDMTACKIGLDKNMRKNTPAPETDPSLFQILFSGRFQVDPQYWAPQENLSFTNIDWLLLHLLLMRKGVKVQLVSQTWTITAPKLWNSINSTKK